MSVVAEPIEVSARTRRRRFKWTRRLIVLAAFLLLVAAALPEVTSGPRLAAAIASFAAGNLNESVQIAEARWGWWSGLELKDFRTQLADGTQVAIDRVAIQTGLWDLCQGRDLRDVQIDGLTVDLTVPAPNRAGSTRPAGSTAPVAGEASEETPKATAKPMPVPTRAARLMKRKPEQKSNVDNIPVNQIILSRCLVNIREPAGRTTRIFLPTGQVNLDRQSGAVNWRVSAKIDNSGLVASEGSFILPRLAIVPTDLGGHLRVAWSDMPLTDLPEEMLQRLGLRQMGGSTTGRVQMRLKPDWTLSWEASVSVKDMASRSKEGKDIRLAQAAAGLSGRWQMIDQQVELSEAWAHLPGAQVRVTGPGLVYDGRTNQVVRSSLAGAITDAEVLRRTLAGLGLEMPPELELAGRGTFEVHVDRQQEATRIEVGASGEQLAALWPGVFHRRAGSPLDVRAVCLLGDDGSLVLQSGQVRLPGGSLTASAELASVPGASVRAVMLREARGEFRWDDFERFAAQVPAVSVQLASLGSIRGPGSASGWATVSGENGGAVAASVTLPAGAEIELGDYLHKPAGQDLRVDVASHLSPRLDSVGVDRIAVESGGQTLVRVQDIRARASKQMQADGDVQRPILLIDLEAALAGIDLSGLQGLSPRLAAAIGAAGRVSGTVRGRTSVSCWADISNRQMRFMGVNAAGELDFDRTALRIDGVVCKPAGEKLRLSSSYSYHWGDHKSGGYGSGSIEAAGFTAQGWYERSPVKSGPQQWAWGCLDVQDVERTAAMLPAVAQAVQRDHLAGQVGARWEWSCQRDTFDLHTLLDLTGVQAVRAEAGIRKPAGLPARVEVAVSGPAGVAAGKQARRWRLPQAQFTLGQSHAEIRDGEMEMAEPWARLLAGEVREALGRVDFTWPILSARAKVSGVTVFGESPVSANVETLLDQLRAAGPVQWTLDCNYEFTKGIHYAANLQASELALGAGLLDKRSGVALRTDIQGKVESYRDSQNVPHVKVTVSDAAGTVSNLAWKAQAEMLYQVVGGEPDLLQAKVTGGGESQQLGELVSLVPLARAWQLQGHVAWDGACSFEKQKGWKLDDLDVGAWPIEGVWLGAPVRVEGLINLQQDRAASTGLFAKVGATEGRFTFHGSREGNVLVNQVGMAFAMIDVDELAGLYRKAVAGSKLPVADKQLPVNSKQVPVDGKQFAVVGDNHQGSARGVDTGPVVDLVRSRVEFMGQTEGLRFRMEEGKDPVSLHLLGWEGSLADGQVQVDLAGAFESGALTAQVIGKIDGKSPLKIRYRAERSLPTELTQHLVVRSFPGMRVDGPVTLDETLVIDPASQAPAIASSGEMIVEGGEVWGAAAPASVQRIFPGLQLTRFKYTRLHNWFEKDAQGKTTNRMIFRGSPWSLYMSGWSKMDGTFRYEIGVDLLGPIESEYWATADRGRVPLFIKTGQVVGGKMHDEVIRYLTPQQILSRIVKDNLVTIAYHAVRQRVVGGREAATSAPASQPATAGADKVTR